MIRRATIQDINDICKLLEQVLEVHHAGRPDLFCAYGKKYDQEALEGMVACERNPIFYMMRADMLPVISCVRNRVLKEARCCCL